MSFTMSVMLTGEKARDVYPDALIELPPGVLSLQGLFWTFDMRRVEYETHVVERKALTEHDALLAVPALVQDFKDLLREKLDGAEAIEWRVTPGFELLPPVKANKKLNLPAEPLWTVRIRARFSVHKILGVAEDIQMAA